MHEEEDGVEALSVQRREVSAARVVDAALAHDLHRFRRHINCGHLEPTTLELEGVPTGSGPEIQSSATTQPESGSFKLRERLVIWSVEFLDRGRFVDPDIRVNDDSSRGGAAVEVE
jgi:hypothetical protein